MKKIDVFDWMTSKGLFNWMPDEMYLKMRYKKKFHRALDLKNPKTFNEKIQWLKLHDRKPEYTQMVDKYEAKKFVADRIGKEYIIPTLGVWDRFEEIDFDTLPNQFVLKCTHDSGGLVICRDKSRLDREAARRKIEKSLKTNYYYHGREWPYKNVRPRIIAEQYMEDKKTGDPMDYKFFSFGGMVKCYKIDFDRFVEHHANYFDPEGNILPFGEIVYPPVMGRELETSPNLPLMKQLAETLSAQIPFLRADFYDIDGKVYFGELMFYPASGFGMFTSIEADNLLGDWIKLPESCGGGYCLIGEQYVLWLHKKEKQQIPLPTKVEGLTDYKFYCFDGKPEFLYISKGLEEHSTASISFVTMDWQFAPYRRSDYRPFETLPKKPQGFNEMVQLAERLSKEIPFLRVDMYQIGDKVYFSELTFSPCSGFMPFENSEHDAEIGQMISLPE